MKIGIGIDTGGTYTDAVIYDFERKKILASAKSLTTKDDLSRGILGAIDGLDSDLLQKAEVISLSTTLATNACVEDKGGHAKLIFFGGEKKVIDENGPKYGLPSSSEMLIEKCVTKFSGEIVEEPNWEDFSRKIEDGFEELDGVGIIEMSAMRNGAKVEKRAKKIFEARYDIPVVCSHELFSELNCLQRGSSTLLNAGLFPVIKEFLTAIKKSLAARNIHATLVIVRSDGSRMSEEFASSHPVETLLCGPAASTIGGTQLTDNKNSIIVDMGGTTTDISLVKEGLPVTAVDGVSIGRWKTFVDGLYIKTFGLGGDSAVHYDNNAMFLEDYRIVPLCVAAHEHPSIVENLRKLNKDVRKHTKFLYEHFLLIKDISNSVRYSQEQKAFCNAIKDRPLIMSDAAAAVGKDIYNLDVSELLKDGVVQICGLTPTDIMHITGDFDRYSKEASLLGAEFAAFNLGISVDELCERVYTEVKRKIYINIVKAMLENKYDHYMKNGVPPEIETLIDESFQEALTGSRDSLFSMMIKTRYSLVGIGAPIRIFLEDVAKLLGTNAIIPEHYEVANAMGAIIGNIGATFDVEIRPINNTGGTVGYTVYASEEVRVFEELEDAQAFAIEDAQIAAKKEARKRGAKGEITVTYHVDEKASATKDGAIYLGTTVSAYAVGAVSF